jgi:TRAP-type C4-dicarboxylate transport system substrate-binding protein
MANSPRFSAALAALAAGAAAAALVSGEAAAQRITMSVVSGSPPAHVISDGGVKPWMTCVSKAMGDNIQFNYFPAGQLIALRELQAGLESGVADSVPIPVGYVSEKLPLNGVSALPGLGSSAKEIITAYSKAIRANKHLAAEFAKINAVPIWAMAFPPYQIVSMGKPMRTLADFKGNVVRSAGGTMTLAIKALGAAPAEVVVSDLYVAMDRGTVNSTISALASVKPYNLQEIIKSVSTNGAFGTFANVFSINGAFWAKLPTNVQQTFRDCGSQVEESIAARMDAEVGELAKEFAGRGITVFEFTPEEKAAIQGALAAVHDDWVGRLKGRGLPAADVLESYKANLAGK